MLSTLTCTLFTIRVQYCIWKWRAVHSKSSVCRHGKAATRRPWNQCSRHVMFTFPVGPSVFTRVELKRARVTGSEALFWGTQLAAPRRHNPHRGVDEKGLAGTAPEEPPDLWFWGFWEGNASRRAVRRHSGALHRARAAPGRLALGARGGHNALRATPLLSSRAESYGVKYCQHYCNYTVHSKKEQR